MVKPIWKLVLAGLAMFAGLAFDRPDLHAQVARLSDDELAAARKAVDDYVQEKHRWPRSSYRIELKRRDGDILDFWIVHKDDEKSIVPGGGKSISVDLDLKSLRILREFKFQ